MFYRLDIYKWGLLLLPPVLRRRRLYALLRVMLGPLHGLMQDFRTFRTNSIYRMNINGQVIYIEKALNDAFLLENREIYLTDTADPIADASVVYPDAGITMTVYEEGAADTTYIKAAGDGKLSADFIINVPSFLSSETERIRAIVEYNRPAGRSYGINIYDYE